MLILRFAPEPSASSRSDLQSPSQLYPQKLEGIQQSLAEHVQGAVWGIAGNVLTRSGLPQERSFLQRLELDLSWPNTLRYVFAGQENVIVQALQ